MLNTLIWKTSVFVVSYFKPKGPLFYLLSGALRIFIVFHLCLSPKKLLLFDDSYPGPYKALLFTLSYLEPREALMYWLLSGALIVMGLGTNQPLWIILCHLPEQGIKVIE